jgi:hypothetical protein
MPLFVLIVIILAFRDPHFNFHFPPQIAQPATKMAAFPGSILLLKYQHL